MLIVNGGIPRSGTVLVGNLVRLMLERRDIPWKRYNPQEPRDLAGFLQTVRTAPSQPALIVHTHLIAPEIIDALANRKDAVLIWNHRDPRDALVSLAKLHDMALPEAIHALKLYCIAAETALAARHCIEIRYDALTTDTQAHIQLLAKALHFRLPPGETEALLQETSTDRHRGVMVQLTKGALPGMQSIQTKRRTMTEDPKTLINDRHIQSGKTGRWHNELTAEQQTKVQTALAHWISTFGYDSATG